MWLAVARFETKNQGFWSNRENSEKLGISDHAPRTIKGKEFQAIFKGFSAQDLAGLTHRIKNIFKMAAAQKRLFFIVLFLYCSLIGRNLDIP